MTFFDAGIKSDVKDVITKTFMKLGNMRGIFKAEDVFVIKSPIKLVSFGSNHDKSRSLNKLKKDPFNQSITNDLKN